MAIEGRNRLFGFMVSEEESILWGDKEAGGWSRKLRDHIFDLKQQREQARGGWRLQPLGMGFLRQACTFP